MDQDKVIDRVRKLLKLGTNEAAAEGERENAMRMAFNLLAKHNLAMADVGDTAAPQEQREEQQAQMSVYPWARNIANSIAGLFFCKYLFARPWKGKLATHSFIGRQSNAITANELAQYVVRSVFKELRQRYGSETSPEARSFAVGVADTISRRCHEMRAQAERKDAPQAATGSALVLASLYKTEQAANDAWALQAYGELKTVADRQKDVHRDAYRGGREHGKSISLNAQIGTGKSNVKRLT